MWEGCDVVLARVGAVTIKVRAGESGKVRRVSEIEDVCGGGLIGGMKEGGSFARAGVAFEDADVVASSSEFGLLGSPRGRPEVFAADFGYCDGEIVVGKIVCVEGCVVVVVTDIAEEEGTGGGVRESFERKSASWGPPRVEVGTG